MIVTGLPTASAPIASRAATLRARCSYCGTTIDPSRAPLAAVPSNVRRYTHEVFHLWRCASCACIHCLEMVDLQPYYVDYPIPRQLTMVIRQGLNNLLGRIARHGLTRDSRVLDYGCGWGLLLEHLREQGYRHTVGYDPYSAIALFHDPTPLKSESFDYVVLQDVIEHVEDPREVLRTIDACVTPGGYILVGTPNAAELVLEPYQRNWMHLHPPYHLHIYTSEALAGLGREIGWEVVDSFNRSYFDTRAPGLNMRAIDRYMRFGDGTLDALQERVPIERLRRSLWFMFLAHFGYWWRRGGDATLMFRKPGRRRPSTTNGAQ